jgi:hypothetical protein
MMVTLRLSPVLVAGRLRGGVERTTGQLLPDTAAAAMLRAVTTAKGGAR